MHATETLAHQRLGRTTGFRFTMPLLGPVKRPRGLFEATVIDSYSMRSGHVMAQVVGVHWRLSSNLGSDVSHLVPEGGTAVGPLQLERTYHPGFLAFLEVIRDTREGIRQYQEAVATTIVHEATHASGYRDHDESRTGIMQVNPADLEHDLDKLRFEPRAISILRSRVLIGLDREVADQVLSRR